MARRNRHRIGRYLVRDDESDFVVYDDEITTNPDGVVVRKRECDEGFVGHPQNFVRSKNDPRVLSLTRPDLLVTVTSLSVPTLIGDTLFVTQPGPATHLFRVVRNNVILIGIGDFVIDSPAADIFVVD